MLKKKKNYFTKIKNKICIIIHSSQAQQSSSKPWKNHKEKRNKHEKLRRQFRHLDI